MMNDSIYSRRVIERKFDKLFLILKNIMKILKNLPTSGFLKIHLKKELPK